MRPRLLDLFCGAGGASMGYHMAGFDVTGVDIRDHPDYPFEFIRADALEVDLSGYDAIHASPPCQGYKASAYRWPRLIPDVRARLVPTGVPYVIENVPEAGREMISPVRLCGSSFGLRVRRHRMFECSFPLTPVPCEHAWQDSHQPYRLHTARSKVEAGFRMSGIQPVHGGNQNVGGNSLYLKSVAMGIDWMTEGDLNEAIPPAYTLHIGRQLFKITL